MKPGDIARYKERYKETVGLIIDIADYTANVLWGEESLILTEMQSELEVINEN